MTAHNNNKTSRITSLLATSALAAGLMSFAGPALANSWDQLSGTGFNTSTPDANTTNIDLTQGLGRGYGDLDIYEQHTVNVNMNGVGHTFVGTDITGDPSQILGRLYSDGRIVLVNRNGVFFGHNSRVDVGSIIVSTGQIGDEDLLNNDGKLTFSDFGTGQIVNEGLINVGDAGLAAFVSPSVVNNGIINANVGTVAFAAGEKVTLDLYGDKLVEIAVDDKVADALLENNGTINAAGGTVLMTAQAAKEAVDDVINMNGVVNVASATQVGGKIILSGGAQGKVSVKGAMDASGATKGGTVNVTGETVNVSGTIDANGAQGGKVTLWGDDRTLFSGTINALGTDGFVETSGGLLGVHGAVNLSEGGQWLLDPTDLWVVDGNGNGDDFNPDDSANDSWYWVGANYINAALDNNNTVTLQTHANGTRAGDIQINANILKQTAGTAKLRLEAHNDIYINNAITASSGLLNVELIGDYDLSGGDADVYIANNISTNGGYVLVQTADDIDVYNNATISTLGGDVTLTTRGTGDGSWVYMAGAGNGTGTIATAGGDVNITTGKLTLQGGSTINTGGVIGGNINIANTDVAAIDANTLNTNNGGDITVGQNAGGSVQDVINAINNAGTGDNKINVGAGTYTESLVINDANLTLSGAGKGTTTMLAPATITASFDNTVGGIGNNHAVVLVRNTDNVTIENLTVDGGSHGDTIGNFHGIAYVNAGGAVNNAEVKNIKHPTDNGSQSGYGIFGLSNDGAAHVLNVDNTAISAFQKNGIVFWGAGMDGIISGNTITGAGAINYIAQNGIVIRNGASADITGNNKISGIGYNPTSWTASSVLAYYAGAGVKIDGNTITGTGVDKGIVVVGTDGVVITGNTITGSAVGVSVTDGSDQTTIGGATVAERNTISNAETGVYVSGGSQQTVQNNAINNIHSGTAAYGVSGVGVSVANLTGTANKIDGNEIGGTAGFGVHLNNSDGVTISANTINGTGDDGIWAKDGDNLTVNNNVIQNAAYSVLALDNVNNANIFQNDFNGGGYGLTVDYFGGASTGVVAHNNSFTNIANTLVWNNGSGPVVNASGNWWGSAAEATIDGKIVGFVDFTPFLATGTDTDAVTKGFQGDHSHVVVTRLGAQSGITGRIQEGINLIADGALTGTARTVDIGEGTFAEGNIEIDRAVLVSGAGKNKTIVDATGFMDGFFINDDLGNKNVTLRRMTVGNATGTGVRVYNSADMGTLQINQMAFNNNGYNGVAVYGNGPNKLNILNSDFRDNGFGGGSRGEGDILAYQYNGDVTINNVTIENNSAPGLADYGIQIRGSDTLAASGTISLDNVTISGSYRAAQLGIQRYSNLDLSMNDVTLGGATGKGTGSTGWGALYLSETGSNDLDIGNTAFLAHAGQYINLGIGAGYNTLNDIDATDATFLGKTGATATLAENFAIEDKIFHKIDNAGQGLVTWHEGHNYVTQNSGSIQRAIDASDAGGFVDVNTGTYTENLTIDKALKLTGHDATLQAAAAGNLITVTAANVNIDPFVFDGMDLANNGVFATGADNLIVDGNTFLRFLQDGIHVEGSNSTQLINNIIHDVGNDGIDVRGGNGHNILDNHIGYTAIGVEGTANNIGKGANGGDGIFLTGSVNTDAARSFIQGNTITNTNYNGPAAKGSGILVTNSSYVTIGGGAAGDANDVRNAGSDGIVVRADGGIADNLVIRGNTIDGTERTGIYAANATNLGVIGNTVSHTGRYAAIFANGGSGVEIAGNTLNHNDETGILAWDLSGGANKITGNFIDNTGEDLKSSDGAGVGNGIRVRGVTGAATTLTVSGNTLGMNGGAVRGDGIFLSGLNGMSTQALVQGNRINDTRFTTADGNGSNGNAIQILDSSSAVLIGHETNAALANTITGTTNGDGVRLQNVSNITVAGNAISNIGRVGVWGGNASSVSVLKNTISNTQLSGYGAIHADGGANWTVKGNNVSIDDYGIRLNGTLGTNNLVEGNTVNTVTADGISAEGVSALTITGNFIGTGNDSKVGGDADSVIGRDGVRVNASNGASINKNIITKANGNGITLLGSNTAMIGGAADVDGNQITNVGQNGVMVDGGDHNTVKRNFINGTGLGGNASGLTGNGVFVTGSTSAQIVENRIGYKPVYTTSKSVTTLSGRAPVDNSINGDGILLLNADGTASDKAIIAGNAINGTVSTGLDIGSGIQILNSDHVNVGDGTTNGRNVIRDAEWDGIRIDHNGGTVDNIVVDNNDIGDYNTKSAVNAITRVGIYGEGLTNSTLKNNTIRNVTTYDGIWVQGGSTVTASGNTINTVARHGISGFGVTDLNIIGNNKIGLTGGNNNIGGDGIHVETSASAEILGNQVKDAANDGVFIDQSDSSVIAGNTVSSVGGDGIHSYNGSYVRIGGAGTDRNTITGTGQNGVRVDNGEGNRVLNNAIDTTGENGILILTSDDVEVGGASSDLGNTITRAGAHGILVRGGESALIQNNKITGGTAYLSGLTLLTGKAGAALDGIHVEGNDGVEILANTIAAGQGLTYTLPWYLGGGTLDASGGNGADGHGIFVTGSDNATIDQNLITPDLLGNGLGAGLDGIHVENSNMLTIGGLIPLMNGNKIFSTGGDGIYVDGSMGVFVLNNIISGIELELLGFSINGEIGGDGIDMQNTLGSVVAGNIITDVAGDGIEFSRGALSLIGLNFITNAGDNGINISESALFLVGANQITDASNHGITLTNAHLGLVGWNTIKGSGTALTEGDGINVRGGTFLLVTDNTISDSYGDGIDGVGLLATRFSENTVDGTTTGHGIRVGLGLGVDVDGNIISNTDKDGIHAGYVLGLDVTGNEITNAGGDGIEVHDSFGADILGNRIDTTGDHGILVDDSAFADVNNNRVKYAGADGIHITDSYRVDVDGNVVLRSDGNGIYVANSNRASITNNRANRNEYNGIYVYSSDNATVSGNKANRNDANGIELAYAHNATVNGNTVRRNDGNGISIWDYTGDVTVNGNTAERNDYNGIALYAVENAFIGGNTASNNDEDGINLRNVGHAEVTGNTANSNGDAGLDSDFILTPKTLIVTGNTFDGNHTGARIANSPSSIITSNVFTNNTAYGLHIAGPGNESVVLSGNTFTNNPIHALFESGVIDLTGAGNTFTGGQIGMRFAPAERMVWVWDEYQGEGEYQYTTFITGPSGHWESDGYADMRLVNDTIGSQRFDGQSQYYVELDNGAFFDPGRPTYLNALDSTYVTPYGTFRPSDTGGALSLDQFLWLESKFFHFADRNDLGLFFFGFVPEAALVDIDQERLFNRFSNFQGLPGQFSITLTGMPNLTPGGRNLGALLNSITPAAGNSTDPNALNAINPAAGPGTGARTASVANTGNGGQEQEASCWSDAVNNASNGVTTTVSYTTGPDALLNGAADCGGGI